MSLMEVFAKACPVYLSYGMTYDQFWDGDVCAHKAYREAEKLREKRANQQAYIQGAYFYEALCCSSSLFRGMKPSRAQEYRKEPYEIFPDERQRRLEREEKARYEKIKDRVAAFAKTFNDKRNSERNEVDGDG